jgi:hypothetical protein
MHRDTLTRSVVGAGSVGVSAGSVGEGAGGREV